MTDVGPSERHSTVKLVYDRQEVVRLNVWFDGLPGAFGIEKTPLDDLKLCVNEAIANILDHNALEDGIINVVAWIDRGELVCEVCDAGAAFDPTTVAERRSQNNLADETVGGWGIPLMRKLSDSMEYRREGGENRLKFKKRLPD